MNVPRNSVPVRRGAALWWTVGILGVGGIATGAFLILRSGASGGLEGTTSDLARVERASFDVGTTAAGELEARNRIEIRSPLDQESTIVQIAQEGKWATKGEVLIQLNADPIQQKIDDESLRVRTESAELGTAQTQYNIQQKDNETKLRQAQLKVTLAELALQQWREGDVKKKRQELELNIDKATLELDRLAQRYMRSQELFDEDFVSKDERDRDEVAYIEAISAYTTAILAAAVYQEYELAMQEKTKISDLEEAQSELERVHLNNENELSNKLTRLEAQRERLAIVQKRLDKLKVDRDAATLIAPSEGLIVYSTSMERNSWGRGGDGPLQIGQQVWPNQLLMILPNTTEMVAAVRVSESLAGRVKPGQTASVKVDAAGGRTFRGKVEGIGVMAESGGWRDPNLREYTVRIAIEAEGIPLKPAMRCEAGIVLDQVEEALAVPVQSVFSDGPVHFVYTQSGSKFVRTPIRLGRRSETRAEVRGGIEEGQTVLIREPSSGEVLAKAWEPESLKTLGYRLGEDGKPMPEMPAAARAAGTPPQGRRGGEGGGRGERQGGETKAHSEATSTEAKQGG